LAIVLKLRVLGEEIMLLGETQANLHEYYLVCPQGTGSSMAKKVPMAKRHAGKGFG
jgi:hypothetical protein